MIQTRDGAASPDTLLLSPATLNPFTEPVGGMGWLSGPLRAGVGSSVLDLLPQPL